MGKANQSQADFVSIKTEETRRSWVKAPRETGTKARRRSSCWRTCTRKTSDGGPCNMGLRLPRPASGADAGGDAQGNHDPDDARGAPWLAERDVPHQGPRCREQGNVPRADSLKALVVEKRGRHTGEERAEDRGEGDKDGGPEGRRRRELIGGRGGADAAGGGGCGG